MGKSYEVGVAWSADHVGGTKFYEVVTITERDGFAIETKVIGHFGKMTLRSTGRLRGQKKVYGTDKQAVELQNEKRKSGYTDTHVGGTYAIGTYSTLDQAIASLENVGMSFSASEKHKLGMISSMADVRKSALDDGSDRIASEPVTAARANLGAIATTREENSWAGTW